jgi:hypothetical protein
MTWSRSKPFVRDLHAGSYLDTFLVSAIGAILAIRFYLRITGYPQVGGETLHIAHMLWGGLLMLAALGISFSFLSHTATRLSVVLGGLGFGTFIDEVGKFVTQDNDYFFQPSVAIMYGTFVVFYVIGRLVHGRRRFTRTEYLVNAMKEMEELAMQDLDEEEKQRALVYLARSDPEHPLTNSLKEALANADLVPVESPNLLFRSRDWLHKSYLRVADLPVFAKGLTLFFAVEMIIKLGNMVGFIFFRDLDQQEILDKRALGAHLANRVQDPGFAERAEIMVGAIAALFVLLGILKLRKSRLHAYRLFRTSILIDLFIGEIFVFAREEFSALVGFTFNLLVLLALGYLIDREKLRDDLGRT